MGLSETAGTPPSNVEMDNDHEPNEPMHWGIAYFYLFFRQIQDGNFQGLVTVPFWVYWTSPKKVAMALTIYLMDPNGWVMFNGDISHDP